ncbi:glucosamine-6-phosphate deaminase [Lysinibacillus yapensis]|uniref:Glucosamine-6-phosphate deaminase n=1 Tax=Ureibacillus yapensis TaxID=2304605 RepID=A0A396S4D9_9BACL|nr:glucosamine-6-phosphate deaminase [Lysinibacillus yapensis]RHW34009.1 glucosamine-6-phosphate deaminase [Lysinibacillus yapensis]
MRIIKVKDYDELSREACNFVLNNMTQNEKLVLGLATGSTPEGLYSNLVESFKQGKASFKNVISFNLDEYVGLKAEDPQSYRHYMNEKLFSHVDILDENAHVPNGASINIEQECKDYEKLIEDSGKIDVQILGLGLNGHIGFNEPGTPFSSRTHIVDLNESTREANSRFFHSIEEVPTKAVTMGIETIMESKKILLLVSGKNKAEAVAKLMNGDVSTKFPASVLKQHKNVTVIADEDALSELKI